MRTLLLLSLGIVCALSACQGWPAGPFSYNYNTSVPLPSRTPVIETLTPFVISPTLATPTASTPTATAEVVTPTNTELTPTDTLTPEQGTPAPALKLGILGCDTGIDIAHGMGEVTNAYVTISNASGTDASNVCATLRGLDEARVHPDKTKCVSIIPAGYQVTLKLTVDTTYKADSPIQVEVTSGDAFVMRAGAPACEAIGVLLPNAGQIGVLVPIP